MLKFSVPLISASYGIADVSMLQHMLNVCWHTSTVVSEPETPLRNLAAILIRSIKNVSSARGYSRSCALLEEPPVVQPLKNFPAFYGTRNFNTVFTRDLYWSLS
jgi:hypothetical protein